jgi:phosphatidate phosphatase APP1
VDPHALRQRLRKALSYIQLRGRYPRPHLRLRTRFRAFVAFASSPARLRLSTGRSSLLGRFEKESRFARNAHGDISARVQLKTRSAQRNYKEMSSGGEAVGSGWGGYVRAAAGAAARYAMSSGQTEGGAPREPGARRRKLLQTASELKQSYYAGYLGRSGETSRDNLPEMGAVVGVNQQLWLFPSYAREIPEHERGWPRASRRDRGDSDAPLPESFREHSDRDYGAEVNIVEVDVRGWLFAPRRGPLGRKDRWQASVVRWMCGLQAQVPGQPEDAGATATPDQAEDVEQFEQQTPVRSNTTADEAGAGGWRYSLWRTNSAEPSRPAMTPAEFKAANVVFDERFAPFTHLPVPRTPVTIFFYNITNDTQAQSRILYTSENGHFSVRASLSFVPTHVRVLASEDLAATEEIKIHPADGISLISDIDDTVKHSGLGIGPREMARAAFTMPTKDIMIPGVADWYKTLAGAPYNVSVHYVSNSPWQLYPVLRSFFDETGLPPGSFHLKHYAGMLQGILEPAAERKKGTVARVIEDFPRRKWLLIGDSGEADLEVYTEMAERWPDRILAICIRDVTSHPSREYSVFTGELGRKIPSNNSMKLESFGVSGSLPPVPPRRVVSSPPGENGPFPPPRLMLRPSPQRNDASASSLASSTSTLSINNTAPSRPEKPANLRSPPVPKKPEALRQHSPPGPEPMSRGSKSQGRHSPPPPPPPRRRTIASETEERRNLPHPPPQRVATALPRMEEFRTAAPPRASTMAGSFEAPQIILTKRQMEWERRWAAARERLDRKGVRLLYWRVGTDLKEITVKIAEKELQQMRGGGWRKD